MGSAAELWQFADPESEISKRYQHALEVVVSYGARVTVSEKNVFHLIPSRLLALADTKYRSTLAVSMIN